jgi:DNA polymerase-3 subunit alpha
MVSLHILLPVQSEQNNKIKEEETMSFVHLHVHSEYSWLDGACTIDDLVQKAVEYKMPAVAITDRNSLAGASRLWHKCIKAGINPIIGLEIEVLNDITDERAFSVILLAKNGSGYNNLCLLLTLAYKNDAQAPKIKKSQLKRFSHDLICLSFGVKGELCTLLLEGRDEEARQVSDWYYGVFGEDYYYEVQDHGLPQEAIAMNKLLDMAFYTKIPAVVTNDCHYMKRQDSIAIDALNSIRKGLDFTQPEASRFTNNEYYFKPPQEMELLFYSSPQIVENKLEIAEKIEVMNGYIPAPESELTLSDVEGILNDYSHPLRIKSQPNKRHIRVTLTESKPAELLEYLSKNIPDFYAIQFTEYVPWTPASIFAEILRIMKVSEEKIDNLCSLIPYEAKTLLEAILISPDFSCFLAGDYVSSLAREISDTLINTFKEERVHENYVALFPKNMAIPIVRDIDGTSRCQYDLSHIAGVGIVTLEIEALH